ncbi:hypothetical protein R3P38DRAFT_3307636 [Favolaschia claudopus]|uniref:DUF6589 domain-containing protein n=1 Tax=Favolaschia claudopus TaxID=2862362 RepID=A0AAW0DCI8_9AGAR
MLLHAPLKAWERVTHPPNPCSSDSESETTPTTKLPSLTSLLGIDSSAGARLLERGSPRSKHRGSSVPSQDSPDDVDIRAEHPTSDDIIFTPRTERRFLRQRAEQQRQRQRLLNREEKIFDKFLNEMKENDISLAEFLEHVFDPDIKLNSDWRWRGFFAHQSVVERIFGYWTTSKYNISTRSFIHNWATNLVSKTAARESRAITESGILAKTKKTVNERKKKGQRIRAPGLLSLLRDACMDTTRALAKSNLSLLTHDNINLMNRIAEQILGHAQENGTCATLIALHNAERKDLLTAALDTSIPNAQPLTLDDIILNETESTFLAKNMVHTILRIIVLHGGEGFQRWQDGLDASQPMSDDVIDVHQTALHPLPSMEIDESSITGNVEVIEEITRTLDLKIDDPEYGKYVQIIAGDQLTIARQRSILNIRLGHESGAHSCRHIVLMPGLFHAKIADCHGVLETHFGKSSAGSRSPGSLGFHNSVLDRLPITLTSLPLLRTCRHLIMVSLLAGRMRDFNQYLGYTLNYAEKIYAKYTDVDRVQELREKRLPGERAQEAKPKEAKKRLSQQTPPRRTCLTFGRATCGDSGRIVIILRLWAFSYRGNGRTNNAHEMLHVLHNLICVWTKELRCIVLQNWLGNPQGKFKGFVEIDLVQEHLNFWIKKIYKADGAGHSWDWLTLLGNRQGSKHATPDLVADISALMASLDEHEVYIEKEGRVLDDDEKPGPDVISVGMAALTHGTSTTPLAEFNEQFDVLRARRRLTPVADLLDLMDAQQTPAVESEIIAANTSAEPDENLSPESPSDSEEETDNDDGPEDTDNLFAESPTLTRLDEEWYLDDDDGEAGSGSEDGEEDEGDDEI